MAPPIDLRKSLNAISDVVNNRPRALREFDQIFMKTADMLLQAEHVSRHFDGKRVVFIGDGDAIGLCLVHLHNQGLLGTGPSSVHVLDFDERVVLSVRGFAERFGVAERVTAELYNVAEPLPPTHWQAFDGFYTNPPFGASNDGRSVEAFALRGFEAVGESGIGCLVIADDREFPWTQDILFATERLSIENNFLVVELLPEFHHYHLDDAPELRSCSMVIRRKQFTKCEYGSKRLPDCMLKSFYGRNAPLRARYVRDLSDGGKFPSRDYKIEPLDGAH
jgi:predicted methyltransferase